MLKKYSSLCLFCSSHISSDTNAITADVTLNKLHVIGLCISRCLTASTTRVTLFDSRSMVFLRADHLVVNNRMKALETRNRTKRNTTLFAYCLSLMAFWSRTTLWTYDTVRFGLISWASLLWIPCQPVTFRETRWRITCSTVCRSIVWFGVALQKSIDHSHAKWSWCRIWVEPLVNDGCIDQWHLK